MIYDYKVTTGTGEELNLDKDGNVVERFAPSQKPETLEKSIEALL